MTAVSDAARRTLDGLAQRVCNEGGLPSLAAATFVSGELVWQSSLGDVGAQYRIGSVTKTFTAVEVMRLRDEGRVSLDEPIGSHLPRARS